MLRLQWMTTTLPLVGFFSDKCWSVTSDRALINASEVELLLQLCLKPAVLTSDMLA